MFKASDVKELRDKTGAGMLDCKKALEACNGNMDEAVDWLREKGISKAAKKESRVAAEGLCKIEVKDNNSKIVEKNNNDKTINNKEFEKNDNDKTIKHKKFEKNDNNKEKNYKNFRKA